MKKRVWRKDGMKQLISSGWKLFDQQTNCITTGNAYCNTQVSSFIRPWKETECNGFIRPEGHLLNFDLQQFNRFYIPWNIEKVLKDKERNDSVILYMFFVTNKEDRIEPFCWVITDRNHKLITYRVVRHCKQSYLKRYDAAHEAMSYILA